MFPDDMINGIAIRQKMKAAIDGIEAGELITMICEDKEGSMKFFTTREKPYSCANIHVQVVNLLEMTKLHLLLGTDES